MSNRDPSCYQQPEPPNHPHLYERRNMADSDPTPTQHPRLDLVAHVREQIEADPAGYANDAKLRAALRIWLEGARKPG